MQRCLARQWPRWSTRLWRAGYLADLRAGDGNLDGGRGGQCRDAQLEAVCSCRRDSDGVLEPLASKSPPDVKAAVIGGLHIYVFGRAIGTAKINSVLVWTQLDTSFADITRQTSFLVNIVQNQVSRDFLKASNARIPT